MAWNRVHSVVFPTGPDASTLPLYLDAADVGAAAEGTAGAATGTTTGAVADILARRTLRVAAGQRVSLATYFNAFPASYWQRWTAVRSVRFTGTARGTGTVTLMRSAADGTQRAVAEVSVSGETAIEVDLTLDGFDEGGWYWADLAAAEDELVVDDLHTAVADEPVTAGRVALGITTYDKPRYCVATLEALAADTALLEQVSAIRMVDQGTRRVSAEPEFERLTTTLAERLQIIEQPNLGGSGGFARSMAEALAAGDDTAFVLLLDDDVEVETEGILRAAAFSRHCVAPIIVGGHMFDLNQKTVLHSYAEKVETRPFMWLPVEGQQVRHDFAAASIRSTPWLHRRFDADYNGWWMCLIPVSTIRSLGLALPVFIKWDDAEYGLRARDAGIPTVSLPGAALWHITWLDKDDTQDWQAYFHARNRFIAALLHSPHARGGTLPAQSRQIDVKHLISMQYWAVALRTAALRDVLAGPDALHGALASKRAEVTASAREFGETTLHRTDAAPPSRSGALPVTGERPRGAGLALFTARAVAKNLLTRPRPDATVRPDGEYAVADATWWRVPAHDSVVVREETGWREYVRDRARFVSLWRESRRVHREIAKRWDTLAQEYRSALDELTSVEAWERTFRG